MGFKKLNTLLRLSIEWNNHIYNLHDKVVKGENWSNMCWSSDYFYNGNYNSAMNTKNV